MMDGGSASCPITENDAQDLNNNSGTSAKDSSTESKSQLQVSQLQVELQSFSKLSGQPSLALDTYQRDFVWGYDKISQLADDLKDFVQNQNDKNKAPYYMGTILLHHDNEGEKDAKRYIIDGQQRLTALCVLHWVIRGKLPENFDLSYSDQSAHLIRAAADCYKKLKEHNLPEDIFDNIRFTVITVFDIDLAFTFFDTQNSRGVPLHATDLLKAYHLRAITAITGNEKEKLQKTCAQRWENVQNLSPVWGTKSNYLETLFTHFLWRARRWTGQQVQQCDHDALLHEFQQESFPSPKQNKKQNKTIPLYRSHMNRLGISLSLSDDCLSIQTSHFKISNCVINLPFAIRQPVHEGIGFFLYTEKYAALLNTLMNESPTSDEIGDFRDIYNDLILKNSPYLREVFELCALVYFDQFGEKKLADFGLWLEHVLGAIRLDKKHVRRETVEKLFKDSELNLLDVIANSYLPEQVIKHLEQWPEIDEIYANHTIESDKGVQSKYKSSCYQFFNGSQNSDQKNDLANKRKWIAKKLKEQEVTCNES